MSDTDSDLESKELEWKKRVTEIRDRVKTRLDENTVEGKREEILFHGMKLVSSATMLGRFKEICYCEETQEYLVIDSPSSLLRYSVEGKLIQPAYPLTATMTFTKLLWCHRARVMIGYQQNDDIIWLMTSFCMIYQIVRNEFRINSIMYNPDTNEAVVAGPNKVTRYLLTNKESPVSPWKTMSYIDSEYGTLWKLEYTSLIPSSTCGFGAQSPLEAILIVEKRPVLTRDDHFGCDYHCLTHNCLAMLRLAGSYMTTLYVLPLETSKEKEDAVPIMFLARNPGASVAPITALLFQLSSQWIIAGDEQGNVTGWDLRLNCVMNSPGGHSRCVRLIVPHPSICGFVTSGEDNVLQIWSCNLRGKMESFSDIGEISGIAVNESASGIATLGQKLACFNMQQLYTFYAALSDSATQIISTINPTYSTRVVVRSADNTVRILTSPTGKQTNLQILPKNLDLVSIAYSGNRERLYTIMLKTGEILVSSTKTNPMELKHVLVSRGAAITCITAYEYYEEVRGADRQPQTPRVIYPKYTLIFVGTEDGAVINVDDDSGEHKNRLAAHKGPVTKLWSSTISKLVVSVGIDKCVKVWRVFANLVCPLALTHSIYYTVPITKIVTMGSVISMASSTAGGSLHQLFMYDTMEEVRLDHHQSKDHTELILDIAASDSLQICASSSMDNTIRIWDHQNIAIKVLEINTCANHLAFSSLRGDIVFGAGRHLYRISYKDHLAPKYRARILMDAIGEETEEDQTPENKGYRIYDDVVDRELLLHPVSSAPLGSLDVSESDVPRLELMIQQQKCAQLEHRDQDIEKIRRGDIQAVKFVGNKSLMTHDAWDKYLEDLLGAAHEASEAPPYDFWATVEKFKNVKRFYNKPGVFKMLYGYSIERLQGYPDGVPDAVRHPRIPLFGFLPNSVIYKLFDDGDLEQPLPAPAPTPLVKYKYPKELLAQLEELHKSESSRFNSRVEITPSQLLNMTRVRGGESETEVAVVRVSIPEEQSPFVRAKRSAGDKRERNSIERRRGESILGPKKTRRRKKTNSGLSSTMKRIIYGETEKLGSIISRQEITGEIGWSGKSFPHVSETTLKQDFESGKLFFRGQLGGWEEESTKKNRSISVRKRKVFVKKSPKSWKIKKIKRKRSGDRGSIGIEKCQRFSNIDDLAKMSVKTILEQKRGIELILRNDFGSVSPSHDEKIKIALTALLARCIDAPTSFSSILYLLDIVPIEDIEIVGFLCAIFSSTSKKSVRKSVIMYLKNRGLRDPGKVLTRQLLVVKNLTDTSDITVVKEFMSRMICDWMETLEKHVALVVEKIKNSEDLKTSARSFLRDSGLSSVKLENILQRKDLIVSPIEGINYFCELNTKFFETRERIRTKNSI